MIVLIYSSKTKNKNVCLNKTSSGTFLRFLLQLHHKCKILWGMVQRTLYQKLANIGQQEEVSTWRQKKMVASVEKCFIHVPIPESFLSFHTLMWISNIRNNMSVQPPLFCIGHYTKMTSSLTYVSSFLCGKSKIKKRSCIHLP